jgi:hypothetical protein
MSSQSAKSVSMALVGGVAAMLFFRFGLLIWAGFVAWAVFVGTGDDSAALQKTIAGTIFGAVIAWVAFMLNLMVAVPAEGWLWVPRIGVAIAITLLIIGMVSSRVSALSSLPAALAGYAGVFGGMATAIAGQSDATVLNSPHLHNPLINVVISMVGGALFASASKKLAGSLTKQ